VRIEVSDKENATNALAQYFPETGTFEPSDNAKLLRTARPKDSGRKTKLFIKGLWPLVQVEIS
jgi:hypothetical protein